mgnify:CR=1 FL=1
MANKEDPLDYDAVIVDEASMIDLMLMNGLVSAIRPGTRLIIVGDADQLPSVGAGNVLRDIIDSEFIYCTKLTEIFRQAKESMIVVNAHRINSGEYPDCNAKGKDFFLLRRNGEKEMLETIKELCLTRLPGYYEGVSPTADIQILTPVRKGLLGSMNLNRELQQVMNPPADDLEEKQIGDRLFREGDKVMQIRNDYDKEVFNGDIGFVSRVDTEDRELTVDFDGREVVYDVSELEELSLAYATTIHKAQGSEYPIVILPFMMTHYVMLQRNLLYTGVTRARKILVMIGEKRAISYAIRNNRATERNTRLAQRLRDAVSLETGSGETGSGETGSLETDCGKILPGEGAATGTGMVLQRGGPVRPAEKIRIRTGKGEEASETCV